MKKYLLLLTILSLLACWPFFKKGYFESHDGEWMVIRFSAFHQTLASGQFPVRFVDRLNNNYGYPVLNFLYPLPFYLAEFPKLAGFGFVDSIKIVFIVVTVTSSLAMFWALSRIFDKTSSIAGAILYLYAPYRFVDLYVRGSLGENVAFTFVPLILGCILKVAQGKKIFLPPLAIFSALLILSHNVIAVLFLPLFVLILSILVKGAKRSIVVAFLSGLLISSFFWIPAIYDLQFVRLSQIKVSNISDHLVGISQLIMPSWGYGPNPNGQDPLPVQIGIVSIFIFLATIYYLLVTKLKDKITIALILISITVLFMMTKFSQPLWQTIPFLDVIQFPWRMLSVIVFIVSFLTSKLISVNQRKNLLASLVIIAAVLSTIFYSKPAIATSKDDGYYATNEDTTTVQNEYLPLWVKEKSPERAQKKIELLGPGQITQRDERSARYRAQINSDVDTQVQVNTIYFPGWKVKSDGLDTSIDYQNPQGLITFNLPQGIHKVIISYSRSPVHLASEIISLLAILATGVYAYRLWPKSSF